VHTNWIETEWAGGVPAFSPIAAPAAEAEERETVVVEVGGKRLEVRLPANLSGTRTVTPARPHARRSGQTAQSAGAGGAAALTAPMQGTIVKVAVQNGDTVAEGDVIVVVEAMKMEQPLQAHRAGTVSALTVEVGATITAGSTICEIA
jgi:acetyl-CoA/propionyl-CoA carboxylase biotin carboxyl carrier protein